MSRTPAHSIHGEALVEEFEQLFREHCRFVYRTAYSVTGNRPDAEDVVQNIFLKLIQRELPPGLRENPKAYLYRAAINRSLNTCRSRKPYQTTGDFELFEAPETDPKFNDDDDIQRNLLDAIARLKPRAVEILILRYTHNYSDAEIARMLGTSRGAIALTLFRARARLKKLLGANPEREKTHESR